jgi:DNA-binding XRE family transcriptional regulator
MSVNITVHLFFIETQCGCLAYWRSSWGILWQGWIQGMYGNLQRTNSDEVRELRAAGGLWLRGLREATGLSQREFADRVGVTYYTFISQLENGRGRLPPDRYETWADALEMDRKMFVRELMRYYDPVTHKILFD